MLLHTNLLTYTKGLCMFMYLGLHPSPPLTVHWASVADVCWMSLTVLRSRAVRARVMLLRTLARYERSERDTSARPRVCSYCGTRESPFRSSDTLTLTLTTPHSP